MAVKISSPGKWGFAALTIVLVVVAALNFQWIMLTAGFATAEGRPALLSDAEWGKPASARKFANRFAPGVAQSDLLEWLDANRFAVDQANKNASRKIGSLPCAEDVRITWATDPRGNLKAANAQVSEGGCL